MQDYKLPNFFIAGAPRAGTTALFHYLSQHLDVFLPKIKEPHYFGQDLEFAVPRMSFREYSSLYAGAINAKAVGDGSVMYLMSKTAAKEIKKVCPDAKIIIMLRHPVDLLISLHQKMLLSGNETIEDFEEALSAEEDRRKGKKIPALAKRISLLYYSEIVRFGPQVERYLNLFGSGNTHVIFYDDFKTNTKKVYQNVLAFLNLPFVNQPDFKVVNASATLRFRFIRDVILFLQVKTPPRLKHTVRRITPDNLRNQIYEIAELLTTRQKLDAKINRIQKERLNDRFKENIMELANVLGRNLSMWTEKYQKNRQ